MVIAFYHSILCLVTNSFALELMEEGFVEKKDFSSSVKYIRTKWCKLKSNKNVNNLTNRKIVEYGNTDRLKHTFLSLVCKSIEGERN